MESNIADASPYLLEPSPWVLSPQKNLFSPLLLVYTLLHTKELRQSRLSYSLMIVRLKIAGETLRGSFISGAVVPPVCQNLSSTVMHAHLGQMIVHHPNDTPLKTTNHSSSRETTTLSRVTLIKMVWSVGSVAGPLCSGEAKYTGQENTRCRSITSLIPSFCLHYYKQACSTWGRHFNLHNKSI